MAIIIDGILENILELNPTIVINREIATIKFENLSLNLNITEDLSKQFDSELKRKIVASDVDKLSPLLKKWLIKYGYLKVEVNFLNTIAERAELFREEFSFANSVKFNMSNGKIKEVIFQVPLQNNKSFLFTCDYKELIENDMSYLIPTLQDYLRNVGIENIDNNEFLDWLEKASIISRKVIIV